MTYAIEGPEDISFDGLRALAAPANPCISAAVRISDPPQGRTRLKNLVRDIEKLLKDTSNDSSTIDALLEPVRSMTQSLEEKGVWSSHFVLYRSSDILRCFAVPELAREFVSVEDHFQIRPLLAILSRHQRFYLLGLSQKHVRLFRCTHLTAQEVQLNGLAPQNLEVWLHNRIPDHVLDNRAAAGPSVGSMKGVVFGTSRDRERKDEYLAHFFKEVDKGLHKLLRGETAPLLPAGVEYEVALYRTVNTYPGLMEQALHASSDGLSSAELHQRALNVMRRAFSAPLAKVMGEFEEFRDRKRVSFDVKEILTAADEGRISAFLFREDAEYLGICNPGEDADAGNHPRREEDLLNLAALQTLSQKGLAFSLKGEEMPARQDAAATLRF